MKLHDICGINHHRGASNPCEICGKKFEPQHIPTPWTFDERNELHDSWGHFIALTGPRGNMAKVYNKPDAAFIVAAVNVHDELVHFVKEVKRVTDDGMLPPAWSKLAKKLIAKAEGK